MPRELLCEVSHYPDFLKWDKSKQNHTAQQEKETRTPVFPPKPHSETEVSTDLWLSAHLPTSLALFDICHSQVWSSREALGQVSQTPEFYKCFSPTYYSSSFSSALWHQSIFYPLLNHTAIPPVPSTHQHRIHVHHLPEVTSRFCRAFQIRCALHLQLSCKNTPTKTQADKLPPAFHPEAKAITAELVVCISKHSM